MSGSADGRVVLPRGLTGPRPRECHRAGQKAGARRVRALARRDWRQWRTERSAGGSLPSFRRDRCNVLLAKFVGAENVAMDMQTHLAWSLGRFLDGRLAADYLGPDWRYCVLDRGS